MSRQDVLAALRRQPEVSVLIVGAGVNGIGVFRDLAMQGVDVLLIDRADFCAGASAASSHMLHGGLRYLENGEFRLVREALKERNLLLQNAPHYAKPLPTTIPIFRWLSGMFNAPLKFLGLLDKPSERGAFIIKVGLTLYDLFTRGQRTLPTHRFTSRRESLELRPSLNPQIVCTATYYDGQMPYPERICMEMILDTESAFPHARALNYMSLEGAHADTVRLRDVLSDEVLEIKPRIVVNATGPWIDFTNQAIQRQTTFIGGTKGSHIILDHPELCRAIGDHEIFFENRDGRIVLIFPLMGKALVGTTDIRIDDPDQARCTEEEVDYMLELIRHVFPTIHVDRSHIVFRFSGVRPLPTSRVGFTGQISRDHSIKVVEPGDSIAFPVYSLIGGKWTTFRAFAEQATDVVLKRLGRPRLTSTDHVPIGGGKDYPRSEADKQQWLSALQEKTGLPLERLQVLFERYGTRAEQIAEFIRADRDEPLSGQPDYSRREIVFLGLHEKVVHLDDLVLRRTALAKLGLLNHTVLDELAEILATAFGWSQDRKQEELARTLHILQDRHGVTFPA